MHFQIDRDGLTNLEYHAKFRIQCLKACVGLSSLTQTGNEILYQIFKTVIIDAHLSKPTNPHVFKIWTLVNLHTKKCFSGRLQHFINFIFFVLIRVSTYEKLTYWDGPKRGTHAIVTMCGLALSLQDMFRGVHVNQTCKFYVFLVGPILSSWTQTSINYFKFSPLKNAHGSINFRTQAIVEMCVTLPFRTPLSNSNCVTLRDLAFSPGYVSNVHILHIPGSPRDSCHHGLKHQSIISSLLLRKTKWFNKL